MASVTVSPPPEPGIAPPETPEQGGSARGSSLRVLIVTDVYHPRVNGVTTSVQTFRDQLLASGHQVLVVCPRYPGSSPGEGEIRIPSRRVPFDPEDRLIRWRAARRALHDVVAWRPDLVHVQTPFLAHRFGRELSRRLDIPLIVTYHTFFEEYLHHYVPMLPRRLSYAIARRFTRSQCRDATEVIVPSSAMFEVLEDYGVTTPMSVLPTPVSISVPPCDGELFRARHRIPAERPVLVHVGRIAHEKNIPLLLRVTQAVRREIPDVLLVIAGEGPAVRSLEKLAGRLGLNGSILFVGYLSRDRELWSCYKAGDLFVFASRTETQGLVLLEAMAAGVPVVSVAELGSRDILTPESGATVVTDQDQFTTAVVDLLRDPTRRRELGTLGRRFVRDHWSPAPITGRLVDLYRRVVAADPAYAATG